MPAALCRNLAAVSRGWASDPLGTETTDAFEAAIAAAPPQIASDLQIQYDEIWMDPEDARDFDMKRFTLAQKRIDVFAVETCGVSVFDARSTVDNPEVPNAIDTPQTDLGKDYLKERPELMTEASGMKVRWQMPPVTMIDGPRSLRNISEPALATFWIHNYPGAEVRYDAVLLQNLSHLGRNDDEIARQALSQMNGGAPIQFDVSKRAGGRVHFDYAESYDDRVYLGRAYAWSGNVFAVTVAVPWNREDLAQAARAELARVDSSISFEPR